MSKKVCFSDIDGTIMHQPETIDPGVEVLCAPPSASGRRGVISAGTIQGVAKLRSHGVKFAVITGARLSTLLMRLPFLPACDAYVCESGGRIFYPGSHLDTACPIREDDTWRASQEGAGPVYQDIIEPEKREGLLWTFYRELKQQGWTIDANGYTTSIRVHAKNGKSMAQLQSLASSAPSGLSCSFNLGAADFYPATSGKLQAAKYLMKCWSIDSKDSVFLCDDDNDMELALQVGKAFLPSITSDSVRMAIDANKDQFVTATKQGAAASEEMIEAVMQHFQL
ncbi:hypothetical protein CEUSTIGMA_g7446.t1 [Chlamydomonas eustigma]|uniref:Sucrose phosphatase-like domain-containing protein n=1 Tax=Chlamydomonas eustigma TaxID=1157962 RepID=A0A250XAA9_9CHLO|nr:hypothetical protein CEUSTIGMA_g7446.t1 [Chlamydomonas eustigma]|eukprot:GAX80007.1 hypothetical protein CEUSTIGMA_g7446.t1 [Chlamydomonas eustigma]